MKRFFRAIASAAPAVIAILIVGFSTTRCTEVNESLGTNFIPNHQQMKLRIDTLSDIETYIDQNDTLPASHMGRIFMGNCQDEVFGQIRATSMTDFFPLGSGTNNSYFGYKPVLDSIFLMDFSIEQIVGNPEVEQTFYIYEMTDSLRRDSVFMVNTPLSTLIDPQKPLFSFTIDPEIPEGAIVSYIKLEPTDEGRKFVQKIMDVDSLTYASPWPEFRKKFNGLYFAPAPDSPDNAAMYGVSTLVQTGSSSGIYPGLAIYYTKHKRDNPTQVDTTGVNHFLFTDQGWSTMLGVTAAVNLSVFDVQFEYPPQIADNIGKDVVMETAYIQSMGGVATKLKFTDELVKKLTGLKNQDGIEYSDMVIDQARLYLPMKDATDQSLDMAPPRLGMYYTYSQPYFERYPYYDGSYLPYDRTPVYGPVAIPDYAYWAEVQPNQSSSISYNGYMTRSQNPPYFQMIVSNYISRLLLNPDTTPREIWLGPDVVSRIAHYSQVRMQGSAGDENPIKLVVTYTLIR